MGTTAVNTASTVGKTAVNTASNVGETAVNTVGAVGSTVGSAMGGHSRRWSYQDSNQPEVSESIHPEEEQGEDLVVLVIIRGKVRQRNTASI